MEFRTLHLEDKAAVNDVLLPLGRNDSALGFANLYSLTEKYGTQIALEDGVLMGCSEAQLRELFHELIDTLKTDYGSR